MFHLRSSIPRRLKLVRPHFRAVSTTESPTVDTQDPRDEFLYGPAPTRTVLARNIPYGFTDTDTISKLFQPFGQVENVRLRVRSDGTPLRYAHVDFKEVASAVAAVNAAVKPPQRHCELFRIGTANLHVCHEQPLGENVYWPPHETLILKGFRGTEETLEKVLEPYKQKRWIQKVTKADALLTQPDTYFIRFKHTNQAQIVLAALSPSSLCNQPEFYQSGDAEFREDTEDIYLSPFPTFSPKSLKHPLLNPADSHKPQWYPLDFEYARKRHLVGRFRANWTQEKEDAQNEKGREGRSRATMHWRCRERGGGDKMNLGMRAVSWARRMEKRRGEAKRNGGVYTPLGGWKLRKAMGVREYAPVDSEEYKEERGIANKEQGDRNLIEQGLTKKTRKMSNREWIVQNREALKLNDEDLDGLRKVHP